MLSLRQEEFFREIFFLKPIPRQDCYIYMDQQYHCSMPFQEDLMCVQKISLIYPILLQQDAGRQGQENNRGRYNQHQRPLMQLQLSNLRLMGPRLQ